MVSSSKYVLYIYSSGVYCLDVVVVSLMKMNRIVDILMVLKKILNIYVRYSKDTTEQKKRNEKHT